MKIIIYGLSKNDFDNLDRWYNSIKDADDIYILDIGSTDKTINKLKELGVHVQEVILEPFRFDKARNLLLDLIPKDTDLCISLDTNESISDNWKKILEEEYQNETKITSRYHYYLDKNDIPIKSETTRIHTLNDYKWINPIYEFLSNSSNNELKGEMTNIIINHFDKKN